MGKLIQLPEPRTEAALDYATNEWALMLGQESLKPEFVHNWMIHQLTNFVGSRNVAKVLRRGAARVKAAHDAAALAASLAELEARTAA